MRNLNRIVFQAKVCDDRDTECAYATVVSHDNLWHGTHANSIATQAVVHLIFCRSLEGRTLHTYVYTMNNTNTLFLGNLVSLVDKRVIVCLVHIWETWTGREILAAQRMLWEEVDMVCNNHEVANLELRVHTTRCVANE